MNAAFAPSLTSLLQVQLDAAVQSSQAFLKKDGVEIVTVSGAESRRNDPQLTVSPPNIVEDEESIAKNGYCDYSHTCAESTRSPYSNLSPSATAKEPTFPAKLHMILNNLEFQDIIAWLPHGRSWRILQQKAFEEHVIPLYFRHGRYSSFARQVNGWGFRRVTHGSDYNSYYHEMFLRGMPRLCDKMRRLTKKDTATKKKKGEEEPAPDFYALSESFPLPETVPDTKRTVSVPNVAAAAFPTSLPPRLDNIEDLILKRQRAELLDCVNLLGSRGLNAGSLGFHGINDLNRPIKSVDQALRFFGAVAAPGRSTMLQQLLQRGADTQQGMARLLAMSHGFGGMGTFEGVRNNYYMNA